MAEIARGDKRLELDLEAGAAQACMFDLQVAKQKNAAIEQVWAIRTQRLPMRVDVGCAVARERPVVALDMNVERGDRLDAHGARQASIVPSDTITAEPPTSPETRGPALISIVK